MRSAMDEDLLYLPPGFQAALAAVLMRSWQPGHFLARGYYMCPANVCGIAQSLGTSVRKQDRTYCYMLSRISPGFSVGLVHFR